MGLGPENALKELSGNPSISKNLELKRLAKLNKDLVLYQTLIQAVKGLSKL